MKKAKVQELKDKIEHIKEYITSDLCKKCEEMYISLVECKNLLEKFEDKETEQ